MYKIVHLVRAIYRERWCRRQDCESSQREVRRINCVGRKMAL